MSASALTQASRRGLLARRSPVLKLEGDERLIALIRAGNDRAFEVMFDRYQSRLLSFCTSMLKSRQDAEDVLQEVFANAHKAMLADERKINLRPWLYRIARNRCLNHLRKPVPEGQDSMDIHPHQHGTSTAEQVGHREELRQLLDDVRHLPETQRTALLLREIDQLSYDEIAVAMDTTIPSIKSLLVRARIGLAESSQARALTCDEVRVQLAEAAEGLRKASGPIRKHVRRCEDCKEFRSQLRSDTKALAVLWPVGPLALLKGSIWAELFGGGSAGGGVAAGGSATAAGGSAVAAGSGVAATGGGVIAGGGAAASGVGLAGGALGAKAAAGMATAALLTGAAVEVTHQQPRPNPTPPPAIERTDTTKQVKSHAKRDRRVLATIGPGPPLIAEIDNDASTGAAADPDPAPAAVPTDLAEADQDPVAEGSPAAADETDGAKPDGGDAPASGEKTDPVSDGGGGVKREVPDEQVPANSGELTEDGQGAEPAPKLSTGDASENGTGTSTPTSPKPSTQAPPASAAPHAPAAGSSRTAPAA